MEDFLYSMAKDFDSKLNQDRIENKCKTYFKMVLDMVAKESIMKFWCK